VCPGANLYRAYNNLDVIGPIRNKQFQYTNQYANKPKRNKLKELAQYRQTISENNQQCSMKLKSKETILKSICKKHNKNNSKNVNQICYDLFCKNNSNEPFCHKIKDQYLRNQTFKSTNVEVVITIILILLILGVASQL
jgi:hypothetical protein